MEAEYKIKSETYFQSVSSGTVLKADTFYVCDGKACPVCDNAECYLTSDIRHAKHFKYDE